MNTTTPRLKLVEALKKNLEEHRVILKEAQDGYRQAMAKQLKKMATRLRRGEVLSIHQAGPWPEVPEDHSRDYEETIAMLEWDSSSEVELSHKEFRQFVLDKWDWMERFLFANAGYSSVAVAKMRRA